MPGYQNAPVTQFLEGVLRSLLNIEQQAARAHATVSSASSAGKDAAASLEHTFQAVAQAGESTVRTLSSTLEGAAAQAESTAQRVASAGLAATESARKAAETIATGSQAVIDVAEKAYEKSRTAFDDIVNYFEIRKTKWSEDLLTALERFKTGVVSYQQLVDMWGHLTIEWEGQVTTLQDVLLRINFDGPIEQLKQLITDLQWGKATIEDALALLAKSQDVYAESLLKTIDAIRKGELGLRSLEDLIALIKRTLGETQFGDIAEELLRHLRDQGYV